MFMTRQLATAAAAAKQHFLFTGDPTGTSFVVFRPTMIRFRGERLDIKLELAKYYKDSETTAYISERSRNSK